MSVLASQGIPTLGCVAKPLIGGQRADLHGRGILTRMYHMCKRLASHREAYFGVDRGLMQGVGYLPKGEGKRNEGV
jgi:hypothetical protein